MDLKKIVENTLMEQPLMGDSLNVIKNQLLQTELFSGCSELIIVDQPTFIVNGENLTAQTRKYVEGSKFCGKCFLYSIGLTPEMYDPNSIDKPVKDGVSITPIVYDLTTFEPKKHIKISINVESEDNTKKNLMELFEKVLDSPHEYEIKGFRGLLIRGVFDVI